MCPPGSHQRTDKREDITRNFNAQCAGLTALRLLRDQYAGQLHNPSTDNAEYIQPNTTHSDKTTSSAKVLAVFEHCIYIELPNTNASRLDTGDTHPANPTLICIGDSSIAPGPIHIIVGEPCQRAITAFVSPGDHVEVNRSSLILSGSTDLIRISIDSVVPYDAARLTTESARHPLKSEVCITLHNLELLRINCNRVQNLASAHSIQHIDNEAGHHPIDFKFDAPGLTSPVVATHAGPALDTLRRYFANPLDKNVLHTITGLLGLGMGLTPAGDDVLSGYIVAITRHSSNSKTDIHCQRLIDSVRSKIPTATNKISATHLICSIRGEYTQHIAETVDVLTSDKPHSTDLNTIINTLTNIGATSGFDWLAGFNLGCHALLEN